MSRHRSGPKGLTVRLRETTVDEPTARKRALNAQTNQQTVKDPFGQDLASSGKAGA